MKIMNYNLWSVLLLFVISSFDCSKKTNTSSQDEIKASSYASSNPVLRGLSANPFLRITVYVPQNITQVNYRKIHCTMNADAVNNIQEIDVYFTDSDPAFGTTNSIASISPSVAEFDIPVNLNLSHGNHFIWLGVRTKGNSSINNKIELHAVKMIDAASKELLVSETISPFTKYCGAAIRKAGDDGVNTYRIPGIIQTNVGTLIAVYDIRYNSSADLPANIDVGMSRSTDSGKTWQPMKVIIHMDLPNAQNGVGDPSVLFDPATGKLWVAALWSHGNHSIAGSGPGLSPDSSGQFVLVSSSDDGVNWSASYNITAQVKNPAWKILFQGPGRGIAMQNGTIVFPAQYWDASGVPYSTLIYSADHGATWQRGSSGAKSNTTESQLVETIPGTLMINMRDNRGSFRSIATTTDMGTTWIEHPTSYNTLPDPVCMGSLIKAKVNVSGVMKDVLFFSNPNTSAAPREKITIKASLDLGQTWLPANQLLIDERQCYGYSCLTKIDDNTIGIFYEGTKDLYFVKVSVSDIIK